LSAASRAVMVEGGDRAAGDRPWWCRGRHLACAEHHEAVVGMRRYLVVANQTLHRAELQDELRKRISEGPCSFFVLVPNTRAAHYDAVAVGAVLPQPGMWWWVTDYAPPATDEQATAQARQRLGEMLTSLNAQGVPVESALGSSSPLEAMEQVLADHQFDEIIVATLPQPLSRWLGADLPRQAERRFGLPVATVTTQR
jgi:hypothetical protein